MRLLSVSGDAVGLLATASVGVEQEKGRVAVLFDTHHQRLYRLARRMSRTADDAKDLVQEAFLRVARSPGRVPDGVQAEEAWMVRILINVCRDRWRREAHRREGHRLQIALHPVETADPEASFIAHRLIWQAVRALPPRRRAVIVLHELEGAAAAEIARLLGISLVTVRWHLSRGRRELAHVIKEGDRHG